MSKLTQVERDALPLARFADPKNRKFPILDCDDFADAWDLAGHAADPDAVRKRILRMGHALRCPLKPAMEVFRAQHGVADDELPEGAERVALAVEAKALPSGEFEVLAISPGKPIYKPWNYTAEVLKRSLGLWDGVEVFINHGRVGEYPPFPPRVQDLCGVFTEPRWSDSYPGIVGKIVPLGPSAELLRALGREMLSSRDPLPKVGFSADLYFLREGDNVKEILRVRSLDCVIDPARGGAFLRALNSVGGSSMKKKCDKCQVEYDEGTEHACTAAPPESEQLALVKAEREKLLAQLDALRSAQQQNAERSQLQVEIEQTNSLRVEMCGLLLEQALAASKLPAPSAAVVRTRFKDKSFEYDQLTAEIELQRNLAAQLTQNAVIAGVSRIGAVYSTEDQLQAAVDDLLEAPREDRLKNLQVHRLSGIRELYHMLTGDYDYHGGFYPERGVLSTTADFSGLVKNALNKIVVDQTNKLGRQGYDWWKRVVKTEHFTSLQQVTGTLIGTVGELPEVAEGGEYPELLIGDSPETADWKKYGGYIPLTLELINRDDARKLKQYPRELANGALRRISGLVAAIFTSNSGIGPTLADTGALFNATVVTTAGGHANLRTVALGAAEYELVASAIYNQPQLVKQAAGYYGTGPKQAIDGKYILVPRVLQLTARQIKYPALERASGIYSENLQKGEPDEVVTVPEFTDATDWASVADPELLPCIFVGERFGLTPEIYIAGDEKSPAVFMNDEHRMKVRIFAVVWVNDFRGLHKSNVAG